MKEIKYFAYTEGEGVCISRIPGENLEAINLAKKNNYVEITMPFCMDDPNHIARQAWELVEGKIEVNLDKAKNLFLDHLRKIRENKFRQLDIEQLKALATENKQKVKEIEQEKEALRKMPESINWEMVESVYDLFHVMPPILL
jgi:hypothetical protein|tara:strand:- start:2180 stop:2608 length:429 start_codon:yes stop_codon:yes gene_type:complete